MHDALVTIVEHPTYLKRAEKLLTPGQMDEIADTLAAHPLSGQVMPGTGGFRKWRYAGVVGKGKSGGVRIIHLFVSDAGIVHIVAIYAKSDRANLTKAEQNELYALAQILKED